MLSDLSKLVKTNSRIILKASTIANAVPTVPINENHTSNTWNTTDIYERELFINVNTNSLYIRTSGHTILQIPLHLSGLTNSYYDKATISGQSTAYLLNSTDFYSTGNTIRINNALSNYVAISGDTNGYYLNSNDFIVSGNTIQTFKYPDKSTISGDTIAYYLNEIDFYISANTIKYNNIIDITLIDFLNLLSNGLLDKGRYYHITNFQISEGLIVQAMTSDYLFNKAYSDVYLDDEIIINQGLVILYRKDPLNNISTFYDWRSQQFQIWETSNGSGIYTSFTDPGEGAASQMFYTFSNVINFNTSTFTPASDGNANTCTNINLDNLTTNTIFGNGCQFNKIGVNCNNNIFGDNFQNNNIDNVLTNSIIKENSIYNNIGNNCTILTNIGFQYNNIENNIICDMSSATYVHNTLYTKHIYYDNTIGNRLSYLDNDIIQYKNPTT